MDHAPVPATDAASAWALAFRLASQPAPATVWRSRLAEALCAALDGIFAAVVTCPPGNWLRIEHDTFPPRYDALIKRIDDDYVPRIDRTGEGWRFALEHFGKCYAPIDRALNRPLAERLYKEVLEPEGIRGYLVTYLLDPQGLLLGFFVTAARDLSSDECLRRDRAELERLADTASATLDAAVSLARGCGLVLPAMRQEMPALTQREREVARLVADGCSNLTVAARLEVSEATVSVHLKRIFAKLGIHSRHELMAQFGRIDASG